MKRPVDLSVTILTDDPAEGARERIRMETQRALALWLGADNVYVELTEPVSA